MDEEMFHRELIAMHLYEMDERYSARGGYPRPWFLIPREIREAYRNKAEMLIDEQRAPEPVPPAYDPEDIPF